MKKIKSSKRIMACAMFVLILFLVAGCGGKKTEPVKTESVATEIPIAVPEGAETVAGKVYTFDMGNAYKLSSATKRETSDSNNTYGSFSISGSEKMDSTGQKNGVPAYKMSSGKISIRYNYVQNMMNLPAEEWQIDDDGNSSVDTFKLDRNIQRGAVVLQKSLDHLNWYNISVHTNAFVDTPVQNGVLYETTDMEMINGCYYRLMVLYKTKRKTGTSNVVLVIPKDDYEFKRTAEVYEFYAAYENDQIEELEANTNCYSLGKTVLVDDYASYSGEKKIEKGDLHYGWELGNFFVSGFTSKNTDKSDVVFLKNVGDVVTLWFNLKQNISALNNDQSLTIEPDTDGHDSYFQTPTTYFGRGMLIIRYTDYENVKHEPVMYCDYLTANTVLGADTRVQLFEEGDYEVALDYEVKKSQLVPQNHHYRIAFKFSVRNANCMVYPFDTETGEELTNKAVTSYGFYLDLAKSRYLDIFIKKEIWTEGADGLTEDTRFNTAAKENQKYVDEGIYTITAKNKYTGLSTEKQIYVGTNKILLAHMNTGLSIAEIQRMIEQGATIYEDGTIELPEATPVPTEEPTAEIVQETDLPESTDIPSRNLNDSDDEVKKSNGNGVNMTVIVAAIASAVCALAVYIRSRKKHEAGVEKSEKEEEQ